MSRRIVACIADVLFKKYRLLEFACAVLLLGILVFPRAASAQVLYGSLTGKVTDQSGAALPNATVEAVNTGTGVT